MGRRILVDVERGRTVKNWKPRRLGKIMSLFVVVGGSFGGGRGVIFFLFLTGGGLGGTRIGADSENQRFSGR